MNTHDRVPRAFATATVHDPRAATTPMDPLRLCVNATVALLAWIVTPPLAVAVFGALGATAYIRARRAGLLDSRCKLGDTRLVIAYLVTVTVLGLGATVSRLAGWL